MRKKPKMILFDYGGTLTTETEPNWTRAVTALLRHATKNKQNLSAEEIAAFSNRMFDAMAPVRRLGFEVHEHPFLRFVYEYLGIECALTPLEMEIILWQESMQTTAMDGAAALLSALRRANIQTAVISNIGFSGLALERMLARLFPDHSFSFVIASSDYVFRKPNPLIFELALRKAGLGASDCWYVGNSFEADIQGASSAGLYPVWLAEHPDGREKTLDCMVIERFQALTSIMEMPTMGNGNHDY